MICEGEVQQDVNMSFTETYSILENSGLNNYNYFLLLFLTAGLSQSFQHANLQDELSR